MTTAPDKLVALLERARQALAPNRVQILCHDVIVVGTLVADMAGAFGTNPTTRAVIAAVAVATRGANTLMYLLGAQKSEQLNADIGDIAAPVDGPPPLATPATVPPGEEASAS